jgi:competence protein ComFC
MNCRAIVFQDDSLLCKACWDDLLSCTGGEYCPGCGHEVSSYAVIGGSCARCVDRSFYFDGIVRCGIYTTCLQEMVLAFKKDRTELAGVLGPLVKSAFAGSPVRERVDLLVPVPLHWTRRLARGYNQAHVIAKHLQNPHIRICRALKRVRRTPYQPTVETFRARHKNVLGAFSVRRESTVRDRIICLVDDIKTSGATLNECAKVLKQAGAKEVYALVLAVAGQTLS